MQGFFSQKETESISAIGGKIHSCVSCGLYKGCQSPKMKPYGKFEKGIMVIGEYPDWVDDERGKPWQGKGGRLLRKILSKYGINLFRDCLSLNAVNCRPPDRVPTGVEVDHCRSVLVWKALQKYQPKLILVLGNFAIDSVITHRMGKAGLERYRGWTIPDQELKAWVCPLFDPGYVYYKEKATDIMTIWEQDIERALSVLHAVFPRYPKPQIEITKDLGFLKSLKGLTAFDYETTGLKPQGRKHEIVCVSVAPREDLVYVFEAPNSARDWLPWRKWLNSTTPKMAHNLKYEDTWSREILKVPVRGWEWDSMLATHVLDNRPGISSLKFQTYVNFGIVDYSDDVSPYLRSSDEGEGGNAINRVKELMRSTKGRQSLLEYCALDSAYEYRLAKKQMEILT